MKITLVLLIFFSSLSTWAETSYLETNEGEEITIHHSKATIESTRPTLIWFTEGYRERQPFVDLVQRLNDVGHDVWVVDILESMFLQRTPANVRSLTGAGIEAVVQKAQSLGQPFIVASTGRMSLIALRGLRLWQLNEKPQNGRGLLNQLTLFFPNLYDTPERAGDAPKLFPIVKNTALPIMIFQPQLGTFNQKLPEIMSGFEQSGSTVMVRSVNDVRDWYFLHRELEPVEQKASEALPEQLAQMTQLWQLEKGAYTPVTTLPEHNQNERKRGLLVVKDVEFHSFQLTDTYGKAVHIDDYKGKVVLLNFWASWCPPCVKEISSMNRLAAQFDPKDFEIVSVNFKEDPEQIRAFLKQVRVDFPVLMDVEGVVSNQWHIFGFPSSFLIDRNQKVTHSVNSAIEWDEPEIADTIRTLIEQK